ncbi:MAG: NAD(P)H-dependent oxidoreductase subunit E [Deltaproteobacteria bacterium]|nr:NAD(P)H-dependent oxidoreductase subunit E [Deltaproteobacteria bacterium]
MRQSSSTTDEKEIRETVAIILQNFSPLKENLIPILQSVQSAVGYIPQPAMKQVASFLAVPAGEVFGVATFYNQFRLIPPGKHPVKVCLGTACHVKGGNIILEEWKRRLGIDEGGVTQDREFSLDRVACVGCCALAPVVLVEEEVFGTMSPSAVEGILLRIRIEKERRSGCGGNEE